VPTVETDGHHCQVRRATTRCTSTVMTFAGKAGRTWVARDRVGVAYDRHDALKNEAAYARHYKSMATMPPTYTPASGRFTHHLLDRLIG